MIEGFQTEHTLYACNPQEKYVKARYNKKFSNKRYKKKYLYNI